MNMLWLFLIVGFISWVFTGYLRRYALSRSLVDVPNERSSHMIPTPRGGGLSIVITFIFGLSLLWLMSMLAGELFVGFVGAGLCVAVIGFVDDHGHIAARWRLLSHFCASIWLLFWLGGLPPLSLFGIVYDMGWSGDFIIAILLVWLLNLYNFMDGIDGIAGIEATSSALVAGLIFLLVYKNQEMVAIHFLMVASVAGFLVWNFPPAKIFMGDAGSGFLGLMLGALTLYSAHIVPEMFWVWLIMLGVFIVDATYTFLRRLIRGDKVYEAHRSHAYQFASREYGNHMTVTLAILVINLLWLAPWSFAVGFGVVDGVVAMICAYVPLLWLAWYYHAGELEQVVSMAEGE